MGVGPPVYPPPSPGCPPPPPRRAGGGGGRPPAPPPAGKIVFVNMDSTPGLGHDPGALTYLKGIGAIGICSTRAAIIERANGLGLLAMQKVFVTDRSNLRRSLQSVARSQPDLVQLMPAIVLRYMERQARDLGVPYLAAGFVQGTQDVAEALHHGAAGVCTSDEGLWELRRSALRVS
ncbi:glycerol-3-phosphate responsive antiterminator [Streptosporangium sandarakinum]|uniref:glycerol-3-phosphate responsive antiterminator n=1 Tax=Streptosporangium sandarakinum TaxID=1260955 RepID=UPI0037AB1240